MNAKKSSDFNKWIYLISGLLLLGLIGSYFVFPNFQTDVNEAYQIFTSGDKQRITEYVERFGFWGPIVIILVMIVQMFLIIIPSWLLMIITILAYGKWWGTLLSIFAVFVASSKGFWIGRGLSKTTLYKFVGEKTEKKLEKAVENYGMGAVLVFRLAPFLSNDAISFVAGMLQMNYLRFIAATLIGISPLAILIAFFIQNTEQLKSGLMWVGGASLLLYILYVVYDNWIKRA
jgi:uncharacterized membrane protein YdjX (TVP38/TMEM64 family)